MRRTSWLGCLLCILFSYESAFAEDRRVVVLKPNALPEASWPEGIQTVTAELSLGEYQLLVRSSTARTLTALLAELEQAANESGTFGAVSVIRTDALGVAYVFTDRNQEVQEFSVPIEQSAVATGAVALRVAEMLRQRTLTIPEPEPAPRVANEKPRPPDADLASEASTRPDRTTLAWLGAGALVSSDGGGARPVVTLSSRWLLFRPLFLDVSGAVSPGRWQLDTTAGKVDLFMTQVTAHGMFDWQLGAAFWFAVGAGGGLVFLDERARAVDGLIGKPDATEVGLLSARTSGTISVDNLSFVAALELGVMLPAVKVRISDDSTGRPRELIRLGRPWSLLTAGLGWSF